MQLKMENLFLVRKFTQNHQKAWINFSIMINTIYDKKQIIY